MSNVTTNNKLIEIPVTVKCLKCHGQGSHTVIVDLSMLIRIADMTDATTNKIHYIKAIRKEWSLPLEPARELAEAALLLISSSKDAIRLWKS